MTQIWANNLAMLEHRWPELAAVVAEQAVDTLSVDLVEGRQSTLKINGVQLTSRHDRAGEAALQAMSLNAAEGVIHLYGVGLGELPLAFLAKPDLQRLDIRILNETIFALILHLADQCQWLADPRVSMALAGSEPEIKLPFFVSPPELVLASDANAKIRDRLEAEIAVPFTNARFDPKDAQWLDRLASNQDILRRDRDVGELFGSQPGSEIYVVATGPTLDSQYDRLRAIRSRCDAPRLICVDTALRPLLDNGIRPDFVVAIDAAISRQVLPEDGGAGMCLVYFPVVDHAVLQAWQGVRYAAYSASPIFDGLRREIVKAELFADGSVVHPAVDLAVKMGARQISLVGTDFAYVHDLAHAGWQPGQLAPTFETAHWVLNGHGQRVKTLLNLRGYLCSLERYIAGHPEVRFLNSSREGAWIAGTHYHPEFTQ